MVLMSDQERHGPIRCDINASIMQNEFVYHPAGIRQPLVPSRLPRRHPNIITNVLFAYLPNALVVIFFAQI